MSSRIFKVHLRSNGEDLKVPKVWLVLPNFEGMIDSSALDNYMTLTTMENLGVQVWRVVSKLENGFP